MLIKFDTRALHRIKAHDYAIRFILGGVACVATGLIAHRFGPVIGGLFLAFPAVFPASATLVESQEREKKAKAGIAFSYRGRLSAALDARGATMGALALCVFAAVLWKGLPKSQPALVLTAATLSWAVCAGTLWRLRRLHTRFWIRRRAQNSKGPPPPLQ